MPTEWMIYAGAAVIVLLLGGVLIRRLQHDGRNIEALEAEIAELRKSIAIFNEGAMGIGQRLVDAERQLNSLSQEQARFQSLSADHSYTQAQELAAQGATVEELMSKSQLPRAEAELIVLIYTQLHEPEAPGE